MVGVVIRKGKGVGAVVMIVEVMVVVVEVMLCTRVRISPRLWSVA